METKQVHKTKELNRGAVVLLVLAVLTAVEYFAGVHEVPTVILILIGLIKGGIVLWYFMHFARLFEGEAGGES